MTKVAMGQRYQKAKYEITTVKVTARPEIHALVDSLGLVFLCAVMFNLC